MADRCKHCGHCPNCGAPLPPWPMPWPWFTVPYHPAMPYPWFPVPTNPVPQPFVPYWTPMGTGKEIAKWTPGDGPFEPPYPDGDVHVKPDDEKCGLCGHPWKE